MKHKHCEVIKAWADGAKIQFRQPTDNWHDCINNRPEWKNDKEYRVKPEPKQLWVRPYNTPDGCGRAVVYGTSPEYMKDHFDKLEWIGPAVLVWEEKL
jgi:hypothetical protein